VNRAICVLPEWAEDLLISKEYTILRPEKNKADPNYLWAVLRSAAVVAEWLSGSTGVGRHRVGWDPLCDQRVPLLSPKEQRAIGDYYRKAEEHEAKIAALRASAVAALAPLELEGETAVDRLRRRRGRHRGRRPGGCSAAQGKRVHRRARRARDQGERFRLLARTVSPAEVFLSIDDGLPSKRRQRLVHLPQVAVPLRANLVADPRPRHAPHGHRQPALGGGHGASPISVYLSSTTRARVSRCPRSLC
jgi:hypothetical protein